jgi:hypothetical protein
MDQQKAWGSRSLILLALLAAHLGLLAWAILAARTFRVAAPSEIPINIVYVPPTQFPRVYAEHTRLEPMRTNVAVGEAPPLFASSTQSGTESAADGRGSAVNWAAEAHRAVRAFEIRRDHPRTSAISVSMSWEDWVLREHRLGERFKTEGGDWIVWINANCYQVAGWDPNAPPLTPDPPPTICREAEAAARDK